MNTNQYGFIKKRLLLAIIFVVTLLLAGGVVILLIGQKPFFQNFPFLTKEKYTGKVNMSQLEAEKKVVEVFIKDGKVNPSTVEINTGKAIVFRNASSKDVNLNLRGNINAGLPIKAYSFIYTPTFDLPGTYKYEDLSNKSIKGEIIVKSMPINKINFKTSEISITSSGFIPNTIKTKKNVVIKFINKTSTDQEIISIGNLTVISGVIKAGGSWETKIYEPIKTSFQLKNEPSITGTLQVE